ncbi:MAG: replicative DNA helicase [Promethearchaeota archaeon]|jgi:replicative DNA helicase
MRTKTEKKTVEINPSLIGYGKLPPQVIDFEEAVLGAMMLEKDAALKLSIKLQPEYFYKDAHQKIFKAIQELLEKGMNTVDILTVSEHLRKKKELEDVGGPLYVTQLTRAVATAAHLEIHAATVLDKFLLRELMRIGAILYQRASNDEEDSVDIAEYAEKEIGRLFDIGFMLKNSFTQALDHTITDILNNARGENIPFLKTGDPYIDAEVSFRTGFICIIAGAEACGKSKYVSSLVRKMVEIEENNLSVLWCSFEDDRKQIIRGLLSMDTNLTTKEIQSINYTLTDEDIKSLHNSIESFRGYDIDFIDKSLDINRLSSYSRRWAENKSFTNKLIVIDNLGLIEADSSIRGVERDDHIMAKIKSIADDTQACIILVHHFTKEAARKFNIYEGYRPRKEYFKGSTRILDYVHQALMVNLPRKYKDLLYEENEKLVQLPDTNGTWDYKRFLKDFWIINPHGDNFANQLSDVAKGTWEELKSVLKFKTKLNGDSLTIQYILYKYINYMNYIDDMNMGRDKKFRKEGMSIYQFLKKGKYNETFSIDSSSRHYYLYGKNINLRKELDKLFIVEAAKNRDGGNAENQIIFRYYADLDHNIFTSIKDKTPENEQNKEQIDGANNEGVERSSGPPF